MPSRQNQQSFILIGAALALPIILLVMLQILFALNREREAVEAATLARAEQITELALMRVDADFALMRILSTGQPFDQRDWPAAYARAREVAALNPHWRNVIVSDLAANEEIFSLHRPYGQRGPLLAAAAQARQSASAPGRVWREGPNCPCVYLHMPVGSRYLLSVALDPAEFRRLMMARLPEDAVAALVDADGRFIARSLAHDERVGTPATRFVRQAVASGERSGIYAGATFEGFRNHSAFVAHSGWSTHIAVASALIDRPRSFSIAAIVIGAVLALAAAAALVLYALYELNRRRQTEARMAQTQKLEAIGQLTGGVAHDFNNLLTVMIGGLNMLLRRMDDPQQRQIAEHMLEAAQRGDKLTKQLLAFSRGQQAELAPVDLHALIPGMEDLLRRSIDPGTTLAFTLDPEARWVRSDANQLELAILNLVINARDAMPGGGRIEIATRADADAEMIQLSVSDTGIGMPKNVAERALEPFFTTKPAGKGTGLGLAQVFGAARQSGGTVEIDSTPGQGSTVRILLPRTEAPAQSPEPEKAPSAPAPAVHPGQRVLVVDDEPGVRTFMADALRQAGYEAVEAEHPGIALRLLETHPPALLLTDYSMPGMTGLELAERARATRQDLRVLIVSGYADADALQASAARPALLRKPFDEQALLEAVRAALTA